MSYWNTFSIVLVVCTYVYAQDVDTDRLIDEIFNTKTNDSSSSPSPVIPNLQPNTGTDGIPGIDGCVCVHYYLCINGTLNINGVDIIDIRSAQGPCGNPLLVCCKKKDQLTKAPPPVLKSSSGCGYRHPDGVGFRITGDKDSESQFGEFPWMVAILREESIEGNPLKLNVYQCGGSLIHPQVVVTAGHCVTDKTKVFKIRAGEWDTQHADEIIPFQDSDVESITIHPQYYAGALYNDIAVLFLKSPVNITEHVDVVCLPRQNGITESGRCVATGWGKDNFGKKGKYQVILKKIDLPVVPNPTCQQQLRKTRLSEFFQLHVSFMCAGGEPGRDTCKGDGGSPLVCPIAGQRNRYYQAGIVSWGIGCGDKDIPAVYTNVAAFRDWIDEQMRLKGFDLSSYQY